MFHDDPEIQAKAEKRRADRMAKIDRLPADLRELVHEYGYNIVKTLMDLGVVKAKHIRHLVETVLDEFSPTRGSFSVQGIKTQHDEEGKPS